MKIEFDKSADALYIQFRNGKVKRSKKIQEGGVILDFASDGRVFGIEILNASARIPLAQLSQVQANLPIAKAA